MDYVKEARYMHLMFAWLFQAVVSMDGQVAPGTTQSPGFQLSLSEETEVPASLEVLLQMPAAPWIFQLFLFETGDI